MATVGYATLQIIPSIKGVSDSIKGDLGALRPAGVAAGKQLGEGIASGVEQSAARVRAASDRVAKNRDKEADAAGKVRVEEAKLQTLRDKGVTDAGRLAAAEERVESAKRKHLVASRDLSSAEKILATAQKDTADTADSSSSRITSRFQSISEGASKLGAAVGAGLVAAGAALVKFGEQLDGMNDALRLTGATGPMLDSLSASANRVAQSTPAMNGGLEQIGGTMAQLHQRLGLTGTGLETLTSQVVELSNMGQTVDMNTLTGTMTAFGVQAKDTSGVLDQLFRVSQSTGVGIDQLMQSATKGGPALRGFGFSISDSAALIAMLDKSGLDADKTLAGMTRSMSAFAKEGKDPKEALTETVGAIQNYVKTGDNAAALNLASKLFGTRGAAQFVDAVKSGAFSVEQLRSATEGSRDTILGAADDTADFAEKWQLFKQKVVIGLAPLANSAFGAISSAMAFISDHADVLKPIGAILGTVAGAIGAIVIATKAWAIAQGVLNTVLATGPIGLIIIAIAALAAGIIYAYKHSETFRNIVQAAWEGIKTAISAVWNGFLKPTFDFFVAAMKAIGNIATWLWNNAIVPAFNGIKTAISFWWAGVQIYFNAWKAAINVVAQVVMWLWHTIMEPAWNGIKAAIDLFWGGAQAVFGFIGDGIRGIGNVVTETKDWIVARFNDIVGFITGLPGKIRSAASGMWDGIKDAFRGAVNFIIDGWNRIEFKIPGFKVGPVGYSGFTLGLPDIPRLRSGGAVRDPNGRLNAPGTGVDGILGVNSAGVPVAWVNHKETVVTAEASADPANAAAMAHMNRGGSVTDFLEVLPGLAGGGIVDEPWVKTLGSQYGVTGATYAGHQDTDRAEAGYAPNPQHQNRGIDWTGGLDSMQKFAEHLLSIAPNTPALEQIIWMNPTTGQKIGWHGRQPDSDGSYYANDYPGHTDHVHTRQSGDITIQQNVLPPNAGAPDSTFIDDGLTPQQRQAQQSPTAPSAPAAPQQTPEQLQAQKNQALATTITGRFGDAAKAAVEGQISDILGVFGIGDEQPILKAQAEWQSAWDKQAQDNQQQSPTAKPQQGVPDASQPPAANPQAQQQTPPAPAAPTMPTNTPEGTIADGTPGAKQAVFAEWAKEPGWQTGGNWLDTLRLINGESSWNVNAANPSSTARGLFQFMDFTRQQYPGYGGTAESQAGPGREYIKDRYKTPSAAWAFWQNPSDKSVSNGHWYDTGGQLKPGITMALNGTGETEAILTRPQWDTARDAMSYVKDVAKGNSQVGSSRPPVTVNQNVTVSNDRSQIRRLNHMNRGVMMQYAGAKP